MRMMMLDIMTTAMGSQSNEEASQLFGMRIPLFNRHCYEAALTMFNDQCVRLSEVSTSIWVHISGRFV